MMSASLQANTRLRGIFTSNCSCSEFDWLIEVRSGRGSTVSPSRSLSSSFGATSLKFHDPHVKVAILLQCHFSRIELPGELQGDLEIILNRIVPLTMRWLMFWVRMDGWHLPLAAMEFCQMCVQGLWDSDSPLRQPPHFTAERVQSSRGIGCGASLELSIWDAEKLALLRGLPGNRLPKLLPWLMNILRTWKWPCCVVLSFGKPGEDLSSLFPFVTWTGKFRLSNRKSSRVSRKLPGGSL